MANSPARRALLASATALIFALMMGPAFAHHSDDHEEGPPDHARSSSEESSSQEASSSHSHDSHPTEDTDDDGVANAPDPLGDTDNAHPSGNDKHVEPGGSGNMGWAAYEPDQDGSGPERDVGGRDQPGGPGGADILDQDGNNGCGNDDDFEDDSEGLCLGPQPPTTNECPEGACPSGCPEDGCPEPGCPQGGCPPPCPPGGCPDNPPIIAADDGGPPPIAPAGVPGGGGDDDEVARPPAPVPVPELAFTGANFDFLVRGMMALALLGAALLSAGRTWGREQS